MARGWARAALASLDQAIEHAVTTGERFYEPELHRLRGEILLASSPGDDRAPAVAALGRAVEVARTQGSQTFEGRAQAALGELAASGISVSP